MSSHDDHNQINQKDSLGGTSVGDMGGSRDEEGDGHQSFRASIIRRIPPTWRRRLRWVLAQSALLGLNFAQNEWVSGVGWVELDKGLVGCLYDESIIVFVSTNRSNCYRYLNA